MYSKVRKYRYKELTKEKILDSFQGWRAYAIWADTYKLRKKIVRQMNKK